MMPKLLLLLPQFPQDPSSGAARSLRTVCELLADQGWMVRALATTATEAASPIAASDYLAEAGETVEKRTAERMTARGDREVLEFEDRHGIHYQLLDTGELTMERWQKKHGPQFNRLFERELSDHCPDIVYGYGGSRQDVNRYRQAKASGARVVFGLCNLAYSQARWLGELDGVLTLSEFQARFYRESLDLETTVIPSPMNLKETVATTRDPIFFTAINPSVEKGVFFLARLAEETATKRPDIPMLFVESRGSGSLLVQAGLEGGFDLRRHESLMFAPPVSTPAEIFAATRVLLVPSVWEEPFGRVAAEALLNGVPPMVSDRGGLAEAANGGGLVLPLPADYTVETRKPVSAVAVKPWLEAMIDWADSPASYQTSSAQALAAGQAFRPDQITPRYVRYFEELLA